MKERKPLPANISPEVREMIERARRAGDALRQVVDKAGEDMRRFKKEDPMRGILGQILLRDRDEVRATDEFSGEVNREDELLEQQERRWTEEDRKGGRK